MGKFVLDDFLPYQMSVLSARISREFSALYRERFGLSVAEWRVIAHLSQTSQAVSIREVYNRIAMDKSKVSRAATRLEARGVIIKKVNAADRRLIELQLSELGHQMIGELTPLAQAFEQEYVQRLGLAGPAFRAAIEILIADSDPNQSRLTDNQMIAGPRIS